MQVLKAGISGSFALRQGKMLVGFLVKVIQRLKNANGLALEDYTARELNVHEGEQLIGTRMLNGWVWCIKAVSEESGWVPLENLKEVVDLSRD